MRRLRLLVSEPFRLDLLDERLWRSDEPIRLSHKGFAVLQCLMSYSGQLVTKDDLLETAWRETLVSEAALTTTIRELRRALGDDARSPRFIQTVHGRGYRFLAPVEVANQISVPPAAGSAAVTAIRCAPENPGGAVLQSRKTEIKVLQAALETALAGHGEIVVLVSSPDSGRNHTVQELAKLAEQHDTLLDIVAVIGRRSNRTYFTQRHGFRSDGSAPAEELPGGGAAAEGSGRQE